MSGPGTSKPSEGLSMSERDKINRRDFIVTTAGVAGTASALGSASLAAAQAPASPPPGFDAQEPVVRFWERQLRDVVSVDLGKAAPELADDAVRERHQIYCLLLMKLIHRFWNGNKRGPLGAYPRRVKQLEAAQPTQRYRGDMIPDPDRLRVNWDRYLGHNIACVAVDGNGEIIDFDFNHNDFFRSSAEHAESRMVRRLFSLTDIFDSWRTGPNWKSGVPLRDKPRTISLQEVTLYTSLESCAQCSGVMSLGGVKQVVYLQNDFTAYMIGNIMFNLANPVSGLPGAPIPIPASAVGLQQFSALNDAHLAFISDIQDAKSKNDSTRSFFVSPDKTFVDYDPSITSFLCTDAAHDIFEEGGKKLDDLVLKFPDAKHPGGDEVLSNRACLEEARAFFKYADIEGFRGSPHKL
jgi:tRNA(Arg) A34 adenosine deaminase TadA